MSELRQDLASGDWILLAPGRAARPKFLDQKKKKRVPTPKSECPFENLQKSGNWPPIAAYPDAKKWVMAIIPNKYPAVASADGVCSVPFRYGIYHARTGVGTHSLLVTCDHNKGFADLSAREAGRLFGILQSYHKALAKDVCAAYISSFHNFGPAGGASLWHPHYQILTLPIIPPHTAHSLRGAQEYYKKYGRCVRCDMLHTEQKKKMRIVAQNTHAVALAPYASKKPFEVSVIPKKHWPSFRETSPAALRGVASLLQDTLRRIKKYLNDPDLNFYIHDTPLDKKDYRFHHWHIEVIPKVTIDAGFELATGILINVVDPDNAAAILRGKK